MRPPMEVWILGWTLWTQVLLGVAVYVVEDPIPLVDSTGVTDPQDVSDSRTSLSSNNRRTETMDNHDIEGPLGSILTAERLPVHCLELRSKRYISDGFCTSTKPITEVVCTGQCIPEENRGWYYEHIKVLSNRKRKEWRCVNDSVRQKRVTLLCDNNETRTYRIKTVRTCKCKRLQHQHNESERPQQNVSPRETSGRSRRNRKNNRQ